MRSRDFCFWLQGFFELSTSNPGLTSEQVVMIRDHLGLVFTHEISPPASAPPTNPLQFTKLMSEAEAGKVTTIC